MTSLEEYRRRRAMEAESALLKPEPKPEPEPAAPPPPTASRHDSPVARAVAKAKEAAARGSGPVSAAAFKFRLLPEGGDAILLFGRNKGKKVSEVKETDRGYLKWMAGAEGIDPILLDVIRRYL